MEGASWLASSSDVGALQKVCHKVSTNENCKFTTTSKMACKNKVHLSVLVQLCAESKLFSCTQAIQEKFIRRFTSQCSRYNWEKARISGLLMPSRKSKTRLRRSSNRWETFNVESITRCWLNH